MPRLVSRAFVVLVVAAAGAVLWGCAASKQPKPTPTTATPASPGMAQPGVPTPAPGGAPSASGADQKEAMRAWVQSSLDSLGVGLQLPVPESTKGKGVTVATVRAGSPAQKGGLRAGDTITSFGGVPAGTPMGLADVIAQSKPDTRYDVVVLRGGKSVTLRVSGVSPPKVSRPAMPAGSGMQPGRASDFSFGK